jgi:hypothetical protein
MTDVIDSEILNSFLYLAQYGDDEERVKNFLCTPKNPLSIILGRQPEMPDILQLSVRDDETTQGLIVELTKRGCFAALSRLFKLPILEGLFDRLFECDNSVNNPLYYFNYEPAGMSKEVYQLSLMIFLLNENFIATAESFAKPHGKVSLMEFPSYSGTDIRHEAEKILEPVKALEQAARPEQYCGGGWEALAEQQIAVARAWLKVSAELDKKGIASKKAFCIIRTFTEYPKYQAVLYFDRALALMERYFARRPTPEDDFVEVGSDAFQAAKTFTLALIEEAARVADAVSISRPYGNRYLYPLFLLLTSPRVIAYDFFNKNLQSSLGKTFDANVLKEYAKQNLRNTMDSPPNHQQFFQASCEEVISEAMVSPLMPK